MRPIVTREGRSAHSIKVVPISFEKAVITGKRQFARRSVEDEISGQILRGTLTQTEPVQKMPLKSVGLDKGTPPPTPALKRKYERLERSDTRTPSGRSSGSKSMEPRRLKRRKKKEKELTELTKRCPTAVCNEEAVGLMKKRTGRMFKAFLKKSRDHNLMAEDGGDVEVTDNVSIVDNGCDESFRDGAVNKAGSHCSNTDSRTRETNYYSENLESFPFPEKEPALSKTSVCLAGSRDVLVISESIVPIPPTPLHPRCDHCYQFGTCSICLKKKRISYNSLEQELCCCNPTINNHPVGFSFEDSSDHGAPTAIEPAVTYECTAWSLELLGESSSESCQNICSLCYRDGDLLFCNGKGCKSSYHRDCVDPPLSTSMPGFWYCAHCVKKKISFGVHSVSDGFEEILETRDVGVSNTKGVLQRQYLVKYIGLAHVHNHWMPENYLVSENPLLISRFVEKSQLTRWNVEWTVPQRLLKKRPIRDNIFIASLTDIFVCNHEWLVKWHGLGYEHSSWELESEAFFSSPLGQNLMEEFEIRNQNSSQEVHQNPEVLCVAKLSKLQPTNFPENSNHLLKNVEKLRGVLLKCRKAVVFDDQDRVATTILFIQTTLETHRPFLIISSSSSLSLWEGEIRRMVPSLDVIVYDGTEESRKGIRGSEFNENCAPLQVILADIEAFVEDVEMLKHVAWQAVVIDGNSGIPDILSRDKMLAVDSMIFLSRGQIKESATEYHKILSLLESHDDFEKLENLQSGSSNNLCQLKDRLSSFIAYESSCLVSKFQEYWVPVQMSNYQLELYCDLLLSNRIALYSCSKSDSVGALREILMRARKCCSHPYVLDASILRYLISEKTSGLSDIGIAASGKLQYLDKMLVEAKTRGLRVLVLYQLIAGSEEIIGDILEDFLSYRFGPNAYERVDAGVVPSKKQAASSRFNNKESEKFVFLLENRACSSAVKLSELDMIIIYDSDWNPANDVRSLQKISIEAKVEKIKLFRLYTSFTVEERSLLLGKEGLTIPNNFQTLSRNISDTLLSWGASNLFGKLDEYHDDSNFSLGADLSSEHSHLLLSEVIKEFQGILSYGYQTLDSDPVISEVKLVNSSYLPTLRTIGQAMVPANNGEQHHVFWKKLLDGRCPQWKHLKKRSPGNRKRINCVDKLLSDTNNGKVDMKKKQKRVASESSDLVFVEADFGQKLTHAVSNGVEASNGSQKICKDMMIDENTICASSRLNSSATKASVAELTDVPVSLDQEKLHCLLKEELGNLSRAFNLSKGVSHIMMQFLKFVLKNHRVNSESPPILHALQMSIFWVAASIAKQPVEKKDSLMRAKHLLNYQFNEEQAKKIYTTLQSVKLKFLDSTENSSETGENGLLVENSKVEMVEESNCEKHAQHILSQEKHMERHDEADGSETSNMKMRVNGKEMMKLEQKHEDEIRKFHWIWENRMARMEAAHKLEAAFIRTMHGQNSAVMCKLKLLESTFADRMKEHNFLKNMQLKDIETRQLAAIKDARQHQTMHFSSAPCADFGPSSCSSYSENEVGGPQQSACLKLDDFVSSHSEAEPLDCEIPVRNLDSNGELGDVGFAKSVFPLKQNENQLQSPVGIETAVSKNTGSRNLQNPDNLPSEDSGFLHNEVEGRGIDAESVKECTVALPENLATRRDEPDEAAYTLNPGQAFVHSELMPDGCEPLSDQVQQQKAPAGANQSFSRTEVLKSGLLDNLFISPSNLGAPVADCVVDPISSVVEVPFTENSERPNPVSVENLDLVVNPPQTTVPVRTALLNEPPFLNNDRQPSYDVAFALCGESSSISPNNLVEVRGATDSGNQGSLPGIDAVHYQGSSHNHGHHRGVEQSSWNCTQPTSGDALLNEIERMRSVRTDMEKNHGKDIFQLKSDCEKEIEETVSQIRNKYSQKIQQTEAEFSSNLDRHQKNERKILMNINLAEAFRLKCTPQPVSNSTPGAPPSSFLKQLHQVSLPPSSSPRSGATSTSAPRASHSVRSSLLPHQSVASLSVPQPQHASPALLPISGSRPPPIISSITAANFPRNSIEIRARAPHLQSSRSPSSPVVLQSPFYQDPNIGRHVPLHHHPGN